MHMIIKILGLPVTRGNLYTPITEKLFPKGRFYAQKNHYLELKLWCLKMEIAESERFELQAWHYPRLTCRASACSRTLGCYGFMG